jgi:phenylalanyl-tRNA synthetase beta subunit
LHLRLAHPRMHAGWWAFGHIRQQSDLKLKQFLPLINTSPVFPVIYDANRTVLSLPPIINGSHSAISLDTRDVFIECTATDLHKVCAQGYAVLG